MQKLKKLFPLAGALLALAFVSCGSDSDDGSKTAGSISYATTSVEKTTDDEAFTNELTKTGDGTVTYASSKTDVATVNATTGEVTIAGAGETTITATVADSDTYTYATKTASYTLTVTEADTTQQKTAGSISYATTSVSKTTADGAFTNALTKTGDGTVSYASSKTDVAEVNATTGEVTIKGAGEATITATVADSDTYTYATKTASYTLTVKQPVTLKTGGDINSILVLLCPDKPYEERSVCTKFARSEKNNEETTLYLDTEEKYIPIWSEGTEVYYYVPDGCTPVMNEDSSGMFIYCSKLTNLNLSSFDTGDVTNMSDMFGGCSKLTSLDVTGFDTSKVTDMSRMFAYCSALTTIYATDKFVTTSVTSGDYCFSYCSKLVGGAGTTYDSSDSGMSATYARIDGGPDTDTPGYFTLKGAEGAEPTMYEASISFVDATVDKTTADSKFKIEVVNTGNGDVTYTSSKETVATVDEKTGEVTIVGAGTATITATVADSDTYTYATKTASYTLTITQAVGTKAPTEAKAVGDIVFSDGSATPYSTDLTLSDAQKEAAIAVIFYVGSAEDVLGAKTLGVGLKNATGDGNTLAWAKNGVNGFNTNITAIQCTPSATNEVEAAATATFTGDLDGSDNWKTLCDTVSDEETSGNYPAWEWVNAYATENSLAGSYANGWYLPTVAELSMLYRVKDTVNSALEKADGTKIADAAYWSSSQSAADNNPYYAWDVWLSDGYLSQPDKDCSWSVCTVRAF